MLEGDGSALVTGATGMIGRKLVRALGEERAVVVGRDRDRLAKLFPRAKAVVWDGVAQLDPAALQGVTSVFHLAGEPVAEGRWTRAKKERIRESRTLGTRAVVSAIAAASTKPAVLVSASAVGFYGSRGDAVLEESSAPGEGFLPEVCREWEAEAAKARAAGVRVVSLRIGIVLAREGGALAKMLPLFRACIAGPLGKGTHFMPWIHVDDVVGLLRFAAEHREIDGALNGSAPAPVTNADFTTTLARVLGRPAVMRAPAAALRLVLGELASVVLSSQRVIPARALAAGYTFRFDSIEAALREIIEQSSPEGSAVAA